VLADPQLTETVRPNRVLRLPTVLERTGYSRSRLYARISDGLFPRPISLGPGVAAWPPNLYTHKRKAVKSPLSVFQVGTTCVPLRVLAG